LAAASFATRLNEFYCKNTKQYNIRLAFFSGWDKLHSLVAQINAARRIIGKTPEARRRAGICSRRVNPVPPIFEISEICLVHVVSHHCRAIWLPGDYLRSRLWE
jgi:hypothetical protein